MTPQGLEDRGVGWGKGPTPLPTSSSPLPPSSRKPLFLTTTDHPLALLEILLRVPLHIHAVSSFQQPLHTKRRRELPHYGNKYYVCSERGLITIHVVTFGEKKYQKYMTVFIIQKKKKNISLSIIIMSQPTQIFHSFFFIATVYISDLIVWFAYKRDVC